MKEIKLTQNQIALIDDDDLEKVSNHNWYSHKRTNKFYAESTINKKHIHLHRFILGVNDSNIIIDHIDGNSLNNQKSNLRLCSFAENQMNKKPYKNAPISNIKGISFISATKKWRAQIQSSKKKIYIGVFDDYKNAALAYNNKAIELHGNFANLNKI